MRAGELRGMFSPVALTGAGLLGLVTAVLVVASLSKPATAGLGIEARYYVSLVGVLIAWIWMGAALYIELLSPSKNDPLDAAAIFVVGLGLMGISNGVIVHDATSSIVIYVLGYILLSIDIGAWAAYQHFVDEETRKKIADPDEPPQ